MSTVIAWSRARSIRMAMIAFAIGGLTMQCGGDSRARGPEKTVRRFFRAMNEKDVNRLLTCFDPRQERMFRATFRLVENATGFPVADMFELLPGLHQAFGASTPEDFRFTELRVLSRDVDRETAAITVSVKALYRSGRREQMQTERIEFRLEHFEEDGWRIVDVRPAGAG